jgi:hypothetical protein
MEFGPMVAGMTVSRFMRVATHGIDIVIMSAVFIMKMFAGLDILHGRNLGMGQRVRHRDGQSPCRQNNAAESDPDLAHPLSITGGALISKQSGTRPIKPILIRVMSVE